MEIIKNILITGPTSYVGINLISKLIELNCFNLSALVRKKTDLSLLPNNKKKIKTLCYDGKSDSIDLIFQEHSFDCVIHLAAYSSHEETSENIKKMIDANLRLGIYLLNAMNKNNCKLFINTGTYWQNYGNNKGPNTLYAATKTAFETIINFYCKNNFLNAITLRLYDVYGPNDHRKKLINRLIKNNSCDEIFDLTKGEQFLYFVHINDVINAYIHTLKIITRKKFLYNHTSYGVLGNEKFSLKEFVSILEKIRGIKYKINWGAKDYLKSQIMDPCRQKSLIGWKPKISLIEGLKLIEKYN